VLIADDDAHVRDGLRELLTDAGFAILGEAADGPQAVALADELEPDVVLMDLRMPGLDGIEATLEVKRRWPLTQVIMLSAYDDPRLRQHAGAEGVYCYLVKGCSPALITEVVRRALEHRRSLAERAR